MDLFDIIVVLYNITMLGLLIEICLKHCCGPKQGYIVIVWVLVVTGVLLALPNLSHDQVHQPIDLIHTAAMLDFFH